MHYQPALRTSGHAHQPSGLLSLLVFLLRATLHHDRPHLVALRMSDGQDINQDSAKIEVFRESFPQLS